LKILPNELPPNPDIEKVKKEEYVFKKDDDLIKPVESNEIDSQLNETQPQIEISSVVDPTEAARNQTEAADIMIIERKDLEKTVTNRPVELNLDHDDFVTVFATNQIEQHREKENLNLSNGGILEGSVFETFHADDDDKNETDDTDEDYRTDIKVTRPTEYSSQQKTMPSSTLLHGFITNPGYPSFYIGKTSDCRWKLTLNEGQSIALTILDLHLRSEFTFSFAFKWIIK
jgi:hypothetical protein